jgi:hypothetical protein
MNLLGAGAVTMREKPEFQAKAYGSPEADSERVRSDLEDRGIDPEFSRPVARQLVAIVQDLSDPEYAAILDGVSAAYGAYRKISGLNDVQFRHGNELQRLMEGFTGELRKLDEGLQMLSTYILRMGALSSRVGSGNPH